MRLKHARRLTQRPSRATEEGCGGTRRAEQGGNEDRTPRSRRQDRELAHHGCQGEDEGQDLRRSRSDGERDPERTTEGDQVRGGDPGGRPGGEGERSGEERERPVVEALGEPGEVAVEEDAASAGQHHDDPVPAVAWSCRGDEHEPDHHDPGRGRSVHGLSRPNGGEALAVDDGADGHGTRVGGGVGKVANVCEMAKIEVGTVGQDAYTVTVREGDTATVHEVTGAHERATSLGVDPEALVAASFRFLLDREPKEAILARFALDVITRYFPEYPDRLDEYLVT